MEIMAGCKLAVQNNQTVYEDDLLGIIPVKYDVDELSRSVYDKYIKIFDRHKWTESFYKKIRNSVDFTLNYNGGILNPANRIIIAPEQHFDITIDKDWAKYDYGKIKGWLSLKGTIDLVTKIDDNTYECIDWKHGVRKQWHGNANLLKDYEYFQHDPQLRMYHYVLHKIYPSVDNIIMSIFYPNDGGLFSICWDKKDIEETENMIRKRFEEIKTCARPKCKKTWKCTKLCHFGKNTFEDTDIEPKYMKGQAITQCEQVELEFQKHSIGEITKKYTMPGYEIDFYQNPGGI